MRGSDAAPSRSDLLRQAVAEAGSTGRFSTGTPKLVARVLEDIPVFSGLSGRHRRRIAEHSELAEVRSGEVLLREGFTGQAVFVLLTGSARIEHTGAPPIEVGEGAVIGELSVLSGEVRTATVTANCDLWALRIRRPTFRRLVEREPSIAVHLLENLSRRLA